MYCFIHTDTEAAAVCKKCGKAMCQNCSAYSGHTGICPACRKEEFEQERAQNYGYKKQEIKKIVVMAIIAVIVLVVSIVCMAKSGILLYAGLAILGIALIVFTILFVKSIRLLKAYIDRINYLTQEIDKITKALSLGVAQI
ncbi:MAG: hypothetical protein ACI4MT_03670 [Christensenellales bacterium]